MPPDPVRLLFGRESAQSAVGGQPELAQQRDDFLGLVAGEDEDSDAVGAQAFDDFLGVGPRLFGEEEQREARALAAEFGRRHARRRRSTALPAGLS